MLQSLSWLRTANQGPLLIGITSKYTVKSHFLTKSWHHSGNSCQVQLSVVVLTTALDLFLGPTPRPLTASFTCFCSWLRQSLLTVSIKLCPVTLLYFINFKFHCWTAAQSPGPLQLQLIWYAYSLFVNNDQHISTWSMPIPCKGKALNQENSILGLGTVTFTITMALQAALGNRAHSPLRQLYWLFQGNINVLDSDMPCTTCDFSAFSSLILTVPLAHLTRTVKYKIPWED